MSLLFCTTDEQAMLRVQAHDDHGAFAQLVSRWEEPIRRLCTRMVGDAHKGEDLKQEAFARLFAKRKLYQPTARFSTFLWRIALNACYDELRRVKRRAESAWIWTEPTRGWMEREWSWKIRTAKRPGMKRRNWCGGH